MVSIARRIPLMQSISAPMSHRSMDRWSVLGCALVLAVLKGKKALKFSGRLGIAS